MAVEEPEDFVILELNQLGFEPGDTMTIQGVDHVVVSRSDDRRSLVLRPGKAKK